MAKRTIKVHCDGCGAVLYIARTGETSCLCGVRHTYVAPKPSGHIELEDANGNRVVVTEAHWRRWPQLSQTFRPVAETPDTPVSIEPPTGDKTEEN